METILNKYTTQRFVGEYFLTNYTFKLTLDKTLVYVFLSKNLNEKFEVFDNKTKLEWFLKSIS